MSKIKIHLFSCLSDNYGILVHDPVSGRTASIDTPDGDENAKQCERKGWGLTEIWNTHWHPDHTGGNLMLKERYGLDTNKGYGTKIHMNGIKPYGITKWHRKTFGICQEYATKLNKENKKKEK